MHSRAPIQHRCDARSPKAIPCGVCIQLDPSSWWIEKEPTSSFVAIPSFDDGAPDQQMLTTRSKWRNHIDFFIRTLWNVNAFFGARSIYFFLKFGVDAFCLPKSTFAILWVSERQSFNDICDVSNCIEIQEMKKEVPTVKDFFGREPMEGCNPDAPRSSCCAGLSKLKSHHMIKIFWRFEFDLSRKATAVYCMDSIMDVSTKRIRCDITITM